MFTTFHQSIAVSNRKKQVPAPIKASYDIVDPGNGFLQQSNSKPEGSVQRAAGLS